MQNDIPELDSKIDLHEYLDSLFRIDTKRSVRLTIFPHLFIYSYGSITFYFENVVKVSLATIMSILIISFITYSISLIVGCFIV